MRPKKMTEAEKTKKEVLDLWKWNLGAVREGRAGAAKADREHCAWCREFNLFRTDGGDACEGCPVVLSGGAPMCRDTPWEDIRGNLECLSGVGSVADREGIRRETVSMIESFLEYLEGVPAEKPTKPPITREEFEEMKSQVLDHWTENYSLALKGDWGDVSIASQDCAFCRRFFEPEEPAGEPEEGAWRYMCEDCPIRVLTGRPACRGTEYGAIRTLISFLVQGYEDTGDGQSCVEALAEEIGTFLKFLETLYYEDYLEKGGWSVSGD